MALRAMAALLAGLILSGAARAAAPLRVVVLLSDATDEKVLTRMRGHASDLPVTFLTTHDVQEPSLSANLTTQLSAVQALTGGETADAVIWFSHGRCADSAGGADWMVVHVAQPQTHSVLARTLGETECQSPANPSSTISDSAVLEGAAIVVRTALMALSDGGTIGIVPAAPAPPATTGLFALRHPRVLVGWMAAADGLSSYGQQGLRTTLGLAGTTFGVEFTVMGTVPATVENSQGTASLSRVGATLGGVAHLPLAADWEASAAVHAGACLITRSTARLVSASNAPPPPEPGHYLSILLEPEVRVGWSILGYRGLAAVLTLGADVIPTIPYANVDLYTSDNPPVKIGTIRQRPWVVQPRAALGLELRLP